MERGTENVSVSAHEFPKSVMIHAVMTHTIVKRVLPVLLTNVSEWYKAAVMISSKSNKSLIKLLIDCYFIDFEIILRIIDSINRIDFICRPPTHFIGKKLVIIAVCAIPNLRLQFASQHKLLQQLPKICFKRANWIITSLRISEI